MTLGTHKCIVSGCHQMAISFSGHVHKGGEKIITGRCKDHTLTEVVRPYVKPNCPGCYGNWRRSDGIMTIGNSRYNVLAEGDVQKI